MSRMTRPICAALLATAASICGPGAFAQTSTLYGLIDASGSHVKEVGATQHAWRLDSGNLVGRPQGELLKRLVSCTSRR